jgi:O-acetyl-ADP-ribose deacetylase (regulator of RNase III)
MNWLKNIVFKRNTMINYVKGDATNPSGSGFKVICHICNDIGAWGRGFVMALSKKWPQLKPEYQQFINSYKVLKQNPLGQVQFIGVGNNTAVCNMIAQHGLISMDNPQPIKYFPLEKCLEQVGFYYYATNPPTSIHMPRIGCGLAGGKWELIEPIIQDKLCKLGLEVFVYDF